MLYIPFQHILCYSNNIEGVITLFGNRLKKLRRESKMTQSDLAKLLDIAASTIGMYEQGRRNPDTKTLTILAEHFNVSVDYLLGIINIRNPYGIETIAAHLDGDDFTEEELADIEKFKEFVKMRRDQK